jgi:hypothetical protein
LVSRNKPQASAEFLASTFADSHLLIEFNARSAWRSQGRARNPKALCEQGFQPRRPGMGRLFPRRAHPE